MRFMHFVAFRPFQQQYNTWVYIALLLEWTKLVCTPASTALFACPRPGGTVSRLYRHIRQAAIPERVVLGTAVF